MTANTFEFDSRLLRTATALAGDGHAVTVVAFSGAGLPARATLAERVEVQRIGLDRRIASGLRPLPDAARHAILRAAGLPPDAAALPARRAAGPDRLRAPIRRGLEILAALRRGGPWTDAIVTAAPDADVVHAKALIALPVARSAARRSSVPGARFVYDIADLHTESARLVRLPGPIRALIRRRERRWVGEAAGLLAATPALARDVARRFGVAEPIVVLNCPPAWHPGRPGSIRSDRLAIALGLDPTADPRPPIVLYQGAFREDQGIEELVAALDEPALSDTGAVVAFLGFGRLEAWLRTEAIRRPGRLAVLPAVPDGELLEWTAGADVAFVGAPPRTANQRLTLPNKLFQALMAGVPIVVAEGTEHCRIARDDGVGRCCDVDSPGAIAAAIAALLGAPPVERDALRARCRSIALDRYSWEVVRSGLIELYRRLAAERGGTSRRAIR